MSKVKTIKLTCPECGEEFEYELYESANVTLDPELRGKVLDGSLFAPVCPKCNFCGVYLHPFLYHDMEHKFMIQLDSYENLMDYKEEFVEHNKVNEMFPGLTDDVKIVGVTSLSDLITTLICFENGLDWRAMQMALLYTEYNFLKYCSDNKKKFKNVNYSALTGQKSEEGLYIAILDVGEGEENEQFYTPVPTEVYEWCFKTYKERFDLINPFVFDRRMRQHFCDFYDEEFQTQEEHKNPYYYVDVGSNNIVICSLVPCLDGTIDINTPVMIEFADGCRQMGRVKRIVNWNFLGMPLGGGDIGRIVSEYKECHMMTTYDSNATLGQDDLVKALIKLKEHNYDLGSKEFPTQELRESNMFMCSMTTADINFEELAELIDKDVITDTSKFVTKLQKIERDGRIYLAAYTDPYYLPSEEECLSNSVFCFDDFVRIIKNDARYSGIIINQYDEDIILDYETIKTYIQFRTLTNEKELMKLLNDLTDREKEIMGMQSYNLIREVYFDKHSVKDLVELHNSDEKKIGKLLDRGYIILKDIVFARY